MTSRTLRSPLLALLGAAGTLTLLACSAADTSTMPLPRRSSVTTGGSSAGNTGGGTTSGSAGSNGATAGGSGGAGGGSTSTGTGEGSSSGTGSSSGSGGGSGGSSGGSSGSGSGGSPAPASPTFDVLVDNASPTLKLADQQVVQVTVTPTNGWTGPVALSLEGAPTDVTASFASATVDLGAAATTVKLTLKSASSTAPVATPFSIVGTAGAVAHKVAANVTVEPDLTISIPVNVDSLRPGFGTINVTAPANIATNPVAIHFLNLDSTPHEIHASNSAQGFAHGDGTFGQNQVDPKKRAITAKGTYNFYLHDEGAGVNDGRIVIQ